MRELMLSGWMSNRGRQVVASFLIKDMKMDWRVGAEWFESHLLDYDVGSNWGNCQTNTGQHHNPTHAKPTMCMFTPKLTVGVLFVHCLSRELYGWCGR